MRLSSNKSYTVESVTWDGIFDRWQAADSRLPWNCLFMLPVWLKTWWDTFGGSAVELLSVHRGERTIGIAPLRRENDTVMLLGNEDVCDCLDFIVARETSAEFYRVLIEYLRKSGVRRMELTPVRPDSSVMTELLPLATRTDCQVTCRDSDVSFEMALPSSWEDYLKMLTGKERHEIRRKLRRLYEAGEITYRAVENVSAVKTEMETFLALFRANRTDKSGFMDTRMASFFTALAERLAEARIFKLFFLDLDGKPVAAAMCFDYRSARYLYNNGYDKDFSSLSVGLLCKVLSIKESIQSGQTTYDFLKGTELYKKRLGGRPVQLRRCVIEL